MVSIDKNTCPHVHILGRRRTRFASWCPKKDTTFTSPVSFSTAAGLFPPTWPLTFLRPKRPRSQTFLNAQGNKIGWSGREKSVSGQTKSEIRVRCFQSRHREQTETNYSSETMIPLHRIKDICLCCCNTDVTTESQIRYVYELPTILFINHTTWNGVDFREARGRIVRRRHVVPEVMTVVMS